MFCSKCGKVIGDDAVFCSYCGNRTMRSTVAKPYPKRSSAGKGMAITGLVFSCLGAFPVYGFLPGLVGLILGIAAKKKCVKSNSRFKGMAIADIVIGISTMAIWILFFLIVTLCIGLYYGWDHL